MEAYDHHSECFRLEHNFVPGGRHLLPIYCESQKPLSTYRATHPTEARRVPSASTQLRLISEKGCVHLWKPIGVSAVLLDMKSKDIFLRYSRCSGKLANMLGWDNVFLNSEFDRGHCSGVPTYSLPTRDLRFLDNRSNNSSLGMRKCINKVD